MSGNSSVAESLTRNINAARGLFSPRNWPESSTEIWYNTLKWQKPADIDLAFKIYFERGRHMPKPADIVDIIREQKPAKKREEQEKKTGTAYELPECDPIVGAAWVTLNEIQNGKTIRFNSRLGKAINLSDDQAILICNLEAKRCGLPSAIESVFWLRSVWGHDKPKMSDSEVRDMLQKPRVKPDLPAPDYREILGQNL